jgi:hypothetical protein
VRHHGIFNFGLQLHSNYYINYNNHHFLLRSKTQASKANETFKANTTTTPMRLTMVYRPSSVVIWLCALAIVVGGAQSFTTTTTTTTTLTVRSTVVNSNINNINTLS